MPAAAAGAVVATELQQSIFNAPPSAAAFANLPPMPANPQGLKPPTPIDAAKEGTRSPSASAAGQKRRRDEEEEEEEESDGDVAMEEDSDDD